MKIVFTNGCFDLLHAGHIDLLAQCRDLAGPDGRVFVALNSDHSIERVKERRPIVGQAQRKICLEAVRYVDHVFLFDSELDLLDLLRRHRPDVLVKGAEWYGRKITGQKLVPIHYAERRTEASTSALIERIRAAQFGQNDSK